MSGLVLFIVVHLTLVILVPRTFLPMLTGRARKSEVA
jgi:thiosulfate reductase cytochrome b subunit